MQAGSHPYAAIASSAVADRRSTPKPAAPIPVSGQGRDRHPAAGLAGKPDAAPRCASSTSSPRPPAGTTAPTAARSASSTSNTATPKAPRTGPTPSTTSPPRPAGGQASASWSKAARPRRPRRQPLPIPPLQRRRPRHQHLPGLRLPLLRSDRLGGPRRPRPRRPARQVREDDRRRQLQGPSPDTPFLTLPTACDGPLATTFEADSWQHPGSRLGFAQTILTRGEAGEALGADGLLQAAASPRRSPPARPPRPPPAPRASTSPSTSKTPASQPQRRRHRRLGDREDRRHPAPGDDVNPSQAEGLAVCSEADLARESARLALGAGCPAASKIGTIEVETPLLDGRLLKGSLFVAKPYENPFGTR